MNIPPREFAGAPRRWAVAVVLLAVGAARASDPPLPPIPVLPSPLDPPKATVRSDPTPPAGKPAAPVDPGKGKKDPPPWKAWQPAGRPVTLAECLEVARCRQPAVIAAQHSLAASERGYLALMNIHRVLELFSRDIPFRRQQALRGIAAATAEVQKAMQESVYDTTRVYFEYVRATQQEQTAHDIAEQMEIYYRVAKNLIDAGVVDAKLKLDRFTLAALEAVIAKVRQLRDKAGTGRKLAVAALAQAMGLEPGEQVYPAAAKLPVMGGTVTEEQVIEFALAARPEMTQVAVLLDVTRLEVCAQNAQTRTHTVPTFALGADLHARILPAPVRNGEYRPGAVPPEMPAQLVGRREDRVARALAYSQRQEEVCRATRNLIRLEAINAYLNWKATAERMEDAEKWFERGKRLAEESRTASETKQDPELFVRNVALAGEAQASYVEAVFEHLKALMTLERVTAGQVRAGFNDR